MRFQAVRPWLGTVVRLVVGVVWIWASLSKLRAPRTFVQAVRAYDATPEWLSKLIGYGLPVLELALGVMLILGIAVRWVALVSAVLFGVFLIAIAQAAVRGIALACGCFGGGGATASSTNYVWDITRDLGLLALAVYLVLFSLTRLSLDEFLSRHDNVTLPSAKRMRTEQGRRKYNAMLEQRRAAARSRDRWTAGSLAAVVLLVSLIGIGVQASRAKIAGNLTATNASVSTGVVFGKKAAATVDIYEDFQCPVCEKFEMSAATYLEAAARSNKAQLRFHMISILDRSSSGNRYSSRAANAALCASDDSIDAFFAYHKILYGTVDGKQVQPAENSNGRPDSDFGAYAKKAGITGRKLTAFQTCVSEETHKALVQAITDRSSVDGVTGTPTIKVNGKDVTASLAAVTKAIAAADAKGPAAVPSVTPVVTPSRSVAPSASAAPKASASVAVSTRAAGSPTSSG